MPSSDPSPRSPAPQGAATSSLSVDVVFEDDDWPDPVGIEKLVAEAGAAVASHERMRGLAASEACVALCNDANVRTLNAGYRGKDKPTNVLSFPAPDGPVPQPVKFLGDIVLARETVVHEAAERDIPFADHLRHLTVHGLLHLLGFDHETDTEAAEMESLETEILRTLGIPDPYADHEARRDPRNGAGADLPSSEPERP
jgi:probable rRNA maturation factor